jgi:hypothetical protein
MIDALINMNFGFSKSCFRTGNDGRVSYHPWAYSGTGYQLESAAQEADLRRRIGIMNAISLFVFLPLVFVLSFAIGPQICLMLLILGMVGVWQYTRSLTKGLE